MEQLPADWDTIQGHLQGISGFDPKVLKPYYEEGPAKKGIHFFLIQYAPGEVIMAKGTTSDYAAVHLQGRVRVRDVVPAYRTSGRGCWERAIARRLENLVLTEAAQWPADKQPSRGLFGWLAPLYRRLPGLPIRLIDFCEHWLSPKMALKLRAHVARALHGRLPKVRRLERELSDPNANPAQLSHVSHAGAEPCVTVHDVEGRAKPLEDRFMGITGTLWNQPRSVTLVAENEGAKPCLMLLIKRKALEEIIKKSPRFYEKKMADFVSSTLPDVLAKNRLFRERLFVEEVRDWPALLAALHPDSDAAEWVRGLRGRLPRSFLRWLDKSDLANLDASEKFQIVEKLNGALAQQPVEGEAAWLPAGHDEARELLKRRGALNDCEIARLNRLLLEAALPGAFAPSPRPFPLSRDEFRDFTAALLEEHQRKFGKALQPDRVESKKGERKGTVLFKQGDPADSIYLILSGMVRIHVELPGGRTMVNNFEADQYFGETAVLEDGAGGGPPLRTAGVETLCSSTLLRLDRDVLRALFAGRYRALGEKLERQRQLLSVRDEQMRVGRLLPPTEPPGDIAERLMLTRNLLLIDMGKCTRCDQCVRGCAEAHDGQPRFHRANPSLRFGRWEAAGACLHCLDAPCQQVCPVGAITWLDNGAVQIHRDRCIGCSQCANECPFGVVDMYEPTSPEDAPSSKKGIVANKCDLCLTEDHDPPCVACCPYDAARRVDPVAFFPDLKSWANFADRA
jgi:Fe-S-cluster-containing hydrogenase component 2/CRP-like cAMP-binding protein